ncbi:Na+/H+ antiporter NhaA [Nocardia sp. CDC159]|uniref:Na(+)/H(+) antiporter NhaA n=1 Tax=Nocardia pulmonis TaxID=2951408 RepID=A0A9X2EEQ7_9NOCA|nr:MULTISPECIES: Na+/H+ antiporter NhaA [Nocardia]MCM6779076.1 Na+/H+ antiporter NhaA [Nocardia pulmonis]MCM6791966.1 Na+/H+ antiporter NhaA [Nocardia sp. CDC159]
MNQSRPHSNPLLTVPAPPEAARIADILRRETVGGALVLTATVLALIWANTPWSDAYIAVREFTAGPQSLHLNLSVAEWSSDGLLAVFFFVAGLELKQEFVAGELRAARRAALPVAAAVGGMAAPAAIYVLINLRTGGNALQGWAIPSATDIAFALAVLGIISTHLPQTLRTYLLTLAVVDDLIAITIIAVFYSQTLSLGPLAAAVAAAAAFAVVVRWKPGWWWLMLPIAVLTWALVHASGVHATVAGVVLGLLVPVRKRSDSAPAGPSEHFEHRLRPMSAGLAVPIFALFTAGVAVQGLDGLLDALSDPVALGIVAGLVVGKSCGITATTYLVARFTRASLDAGLRWIDIYGAAMIAGIGFTVSLLIGELAFGEGSSRDEHAKIGVLCGSLLAAIIAAVILRIRNRAYRNAEQRDR